LAAYGYSRDRKRAKRQIVYGLVTDAAGRPVAVSVFAGNTANPAAFVETVRCVRQRFGLSQVVLVGDRGMITDARIADLKSVGGLGGLPRYARYRSRRWPARARFSWACSTRSTWLRSSIRNGFPVSGWWCAQSSHGCRAGAQT
jgi:hypothetical protein